MLFKEIIGHTNLKQKLIDTVTGSRISHAQLFLGPHGSGNLALAIAYAQFISCENKQAHDSCGECSSCKKYAKLIHPDLHFVYPVNTTKSVSKNPVSDDFIALWRECMNKNPYTTPTDWYNFIGLENKQGNIGKNESSEILKKINLKTYEAEYKVMIIWMPEKMNDTSANKLLKILEEPPAKTLFLLVAENSEEIITTITSRTQLVKVPRIANPDLKSYLGEKHSFGDDELNEIVRLANGSYSKALEVMESSENNAFNLEKFIEIMRLCYSRKLSDIFAWVDEMASIGRERQKQFFDFALRLIRENFMMHVQESSLVFLGNNEKDFSEKFHHYINGHNIVAITEEFNQASLDIERNAYNKIVLLDLSLKIVKLIRK
jgi:DNA polymerase-3 subunit delta'